MLPPVEAATTRRQIVLPMMNKSQADIAYGFTTITRRDPDYYAFWLLNTVVGHYAMGGRLGDNIRERQGMAYYASSSLDALFLWLRSVSAGSSRSGVAVGFPREGRRTSESSKDCLRGSARGCRSLNFKEKSIVLYD